MTDGEGRASFDAAQAPWLRAGPPAKLLAVLDADGEEARVVGGAVRNTLFGLPPGDIDLATTALPETVMQRAEAAGFRAVPTGIEHGTVTVVVNEVPFEVTTLRRDIETDGRHATVRFGRDWAADAARRDFTINALFLRRDGQVVDFVGGLADIAARRVRFIGDPATRIAEDLLRVLRFFRFHAAFGRGAPDPVGLAACIRARTGLERLSRERVRIEILKLLAAPGVVDTAAVMADTGILGDVLSAAVDRAALARMVAVEAALGTRPDALRRLAALGVRVHEDASRLRERLRLTNEEYRRLRAMAENWWRVSPAMGAASRALLYRVGPEHYRDRVLLAFARADAAAGDPAWRELLALPERWTAPKFPLAARDLMERGVEKGPALGAALARAEEAWVAAGFPADAAALAAIADRVANEARSEQRR